MNRTKFKITFFYFCITGISSSPGNPFILNLNSIIFYPILIHAWILIVPELDYNSKLEET